jgi:hypothetical protein
MLAFTSVYFFESGLFNGLRPFGVKKISLSPQLASGVVGERPQSPQFLPFLSPRGSRQTQRLNSASKKDVARIPFFVNDLLAPKAFAV